MFKKIYNFDKISVLPKHIAFIMDGNRRWASALGKNRMSGHNEGGKSLKNMIKALAEIKGISHASFFAFSTENWNREQSEVDHIFEVAFKLLDENKELFRKLNIKLVAIGDLSRFPEDVRSCLISTMDETKNNTGLVVNLAVNYGGRDDIVHSVNNLIKQGEKEVTIEKISQNLYSYPSPDVDLVIRTSGERRISNFMLFQMAYSELYFTKTTWPDFGKRELYKALIDYSKRNRRFGGN